MLQLVLKALNILPIAMLWVHMILEAVRILGLSKTRIYQASKRAFGKVLEVPQKETIPFYLAVLMVLRRYAYWITVNYREAYGLYACNEYSLITKVQEEEKHSLLEK